MADIKVRHKITKAEIEMSEYSFGLMRDEYELVPLTPGKRPVIETPKVETAPEPEPEPEKVIEKPKAKTKKKA